MTSSAPYRTGPRSVGNSTHLERTVFLIFFFKKILFVYYLLMPLPDWLFSGTQLSIPLEGIRPVKPINKRFRNFQFTWMWLYLKRVPWGHCYVLDTTTREEFDSPANEGRWTSSWQSYAHVICSSTDEHPDRTCNLRTRCGEEVHFRRRWKVHYSRSAIV
jgi:hypothetical protein